MGFMFSIVSVLAFIILCADTGQNFPPPLPKEEEHRLFEQYKIKDDKNARMKLIEHNLRLVVHIVRKYYGSSENGEDLISVGTIGLIKAVDSYKAANGTRFATYAAKCIQNEILMCFRSKKKTGLEVSINGTIDTDRDGNTLTYMDIIKCDDTIADDIDKRLKIAETLKFISNRLDHREKKIIILRYGLNGCDPLTQRETSERLGISRSYVSRIEKSVLKRIKDYLNGEVT